MRGSSLLRSLIVSYLILHPAREVTVSRPLLAPAGRRGPSAPGMLPATASGNWLQLADGRWSRAALATADVVTPTALLQSRHTQQLPPVYHAATDTGAATTTGGATPRLRCTEPPSSSSECVARVVGCEYHRGSRRPSLANKSRALFGQCGCSRSFPAVDTYSSQLAEWTRYNPSPLNKKRLTAAGDAPAEASAGAGHRACLSPQCVISKRLAGRWILFMGDSTQRHLHDAFLNLLKIEYGMDELQVQPHLDGLPVKDRDFHKDYDTVCAHPRGGYRSGGQWWAQGQRQREPECFGPLHPECSEERPDLSWWANASGAPATRVSMRFLRGLDAHKLEHNSKAWRERFFYKEWRQRSKEAPPNLLFRSSPYTDHPVTRAWWGRSPEPDAIIFNSCAWDLPQINRSFYYFPYMVPGYPCPNPPPTMNATVRIREQRAAHVVGAPCVKRAEVSMTEEQIVQDYGKRLREALVLVRKRFRGRLILRSCHSGTQAQIHILAPTPTPTLTLPLTLTPTPTLTPTITLTLTLTLASGTQDKRAKRHEQFEALRRMNAMLLRVARELCVEVLDVFELDRLAGYYLEKKLANFHVPPRASAQAALALLLQLRLGVGATRGERNREGVHGHIGAGAHLAHHAKIR